MAQQQTRKTIESINENVRKSQVIIQYGIGAMIDFRDKVLMTAASEFWDRREGRDYETLRDERLEKRLNVSKFIGPSTNGVSFTTFPEWYFCPKCRKFQPISEWQKEMRIKFPKKEESWIIRRTKCSDCNIPLVPARIVVACENGHIDDFPWVKWVHKRSFGGEKPICSNPRLKLKTSPSASSGLEGLTLECSCGAKTTLAKSFDKDVFKTMSAKGAIDFHCTGRHPWKGFTENCNAFPQAVQRGASSVYFPCTVSSLLIPPYSERVRQKVLKSEKLIDINKLLIEKEKDGDFLDETARKNYILKKVDDWAKDVSNEIIENKDSVGRILERILMPTDDDSASIVVYDTEQAYKWEEYQALRGASLGKDISDDFIREERTGVKYDIKGIKSVALVQKLKEVVALTGFSRLEPTFWSPNPSENYVSVKNEGENAYPAKESQGEGIFIEFDLEILKKWASENKEIEKRAEILQKTLQNSFWSNNAVRADSGPTFLLLHTLSHMLIKQLSFECGYAIAAIRERLYVGSVKGKGEMAGILIYTTDIDSEGTMGGLVRQGEIDCLPAIFKKAIAEAVFCSNDPICIYSDGQGLDGLNLAACHTCVLLPETCCEYRNVLLDRGMAVGTFEKPTIGFFSDMRNKIYD